MTKFWMCGAAIMLAAGAVWADAVVYVSPEGKDAWSGSIRNVSADASDGPAASLAGARDAVRRLRSEGEEGTIRVEFADGVYPMTEAVVFTPQDSGKPTAPVIYAAAKGVRPVFSGMITLHAFGKGENGMWVTPVPPGLRFDTLYINGRRAPRAKEPDQGQFYMAGPGEVFEELEPGTHYAKKARVRMFADPNHLTFLEGVTPEELSGIMLRVYFGWDAMMVPVEAVDIEKGSVDFTGIGIKPWNPLRRQSKFVFENIRAALDVPGEWYVDRSRPLEMLYIIPLAGEAIEKAIAEVPAGVEFIRIEGDYNAQKFVEHIRFEGLTFRGGGYPAGPEGFEPLQAAANVPAAILCDGVRMLTFAGCTFEAMDRYVLWLRDGCTRCTISGCVFEDLGAGGVRIGSPGGIKKRYERTMLNEVSDCVIRRGGRQFPAAVGVWIGESGYNRILHNEIHDLYYSGVSMGWLWGYAPSESKGNEVAYNHIYDIGHGLLSDMGAVYNLGNSEGTWIHHNVIHDVVSDHYGGWGLYCDEGSTGVLLEKNLVYRCKSGGIHQHYGKDNIFRNNIFALARETQLMRGKVQEHLSFVFERNIVYWQDGPLFNTQTWLAEDIVLRNNLYCKTGAGEIDFLGMDFEQWRKSGRDRGSITADPEFANPESGNFHIRNAKAIEQIGFEIFDVSAAGPRK